LTDFDNWQLLPVNKNLSEPKYILAHILKMLTPDVKIIVILRNPVKRLVVIVILVVVEIVIAFFINTIKIP